MTTSGTPAVFRGTADGKKKAEVAAARAAVEQLLPHLVQKAMQGMVNGAIPNPKTGGHLTVAAASNTLAAPVASGRIRGAPLSAEAVAAGVGVDWQSYIAQAYSSAMAEDDGTQAPAKKRTRRGGRRRGGGGGGGADTAKKSIEAMAMQTMINNRDAMGALQTFMASPAQCLGCFTELLELLLKIGELQVACKVVMAGAAAGAHIRPAQMFSLLLSLPQGVPPEPCANLVNILGVCVTWPSEDHWNYFLQKARQMVLEFAEEGCSCAVRMVTKDAAFLARLGKCALQVKLQRGMKEGEIVCAGGSAGLNSSDDMRGIQSGDAVALSRMDCSPEYFKTNLLCECEVQVAKPLVLKPLDPQHPILQGCFNPKYEWRVDKLANRMSYSRMMAALSLLTAAKSEKTKKSLGEGDRPTAAVTNTIISSNGVIQAASSPPPVMACKAIMEHDFGNPSQRAAIADAVQSSVSLIQGPPGTGKTTTALYLMAEWVRAQREMPQVKKTALLATSDSNIAVDNLVEGLAKVGMRVVRLGRPEMARPELLQFCADEIAAKAMGVEKLGMLKDKEKRLAKEKLRQIIGDAEVVCCTCIGTGSAMLSGYRFEKVLMDEASQATEAATIVPICKGCKQLVLLGDHCQLPPTVNSDLAAAEGLNLSLFERLARAGVQTNLLQEQYRMHPTISAFPRNHFYSGQLLDGIGAEHRPAPAGFKWPDPARPVALVPVLGQEKQDGTSWENMAEASKVVLIVGQIVQAGMDTSEVGVVTPYASQSRLLRRLLAKAGVSTGRDHGGVEVNSVDSFQGREKDVVVMSCVRASARGGIGFTSDWRRVNVAFTRARRGFIVVGEPSTLSREDRTWAPWLRWASQEGLYCGILPTLPPPPKKTKPVGLASLRVQRAPSPMRGARGVSVSPERATRQRNPLRNPLEARSRSRSRSRQDDDEGAESGYDPELPNSALESQTFDPMQVIDQAIGTMQAMQQSSNTSIQAAYEAMMGELGQGGGAVFDASAHAMPTQSRLKYANESLGADDADVDADDADGSGSDVAEEDEPDEDDNDVDLVF
eukprot:gnl/MRDRNA2_/MRDRNA2_113405_c0_seq1.p1 gnl/MRDRNA2_/MRDRNA2_113405_c0~~gnl/MRDRNA2_/MRDRNA2_113405_c0_seq1.p1  ORF type:complete len:1143 (+),score=223.49 gnl/MRDRNA2_/MRDRNA2_113405_c0_seq1:269-3430(+)